MKLSSIIPKKFLCCYSLANGAFVAAIIFSFIMVWVVIVTVIQVACMGTKDNVKGYPWRNAYSYLISAAIYAFFMLLINLWFIYGVKKINLCVISSWLVVTGMWLLHCTFLLFSVVCVYYHFDTGAHILLPCLAFGLFSIGILFYFFLVVYAFYLEVKEGNLSNETITT